MTANLNDPMDPVEDRNAMLEKALIEEYLKTNGHTQESLKKLPPEQVKKIMQDASQYASLKLEEVEARANFVKGLQEGSASLEK
ncbi:MAG: hypothetical protein LC099_10095 [Anaerolineales bacterium]|nr:hypothetical protein [Anaerolineales bacterium]